MREVDVNGKKFSVRGLRLSEVSVKKMRALGYGRFAFTPDIGGDDAQQKLADIMDAALLAVLGHDGYGEVDDAGGVKGLQIVWQAIMAETYGTPESEKNLSSAGSGSATPSAEPTAALASSAEPQAAGTASGEGLRN